MTDKNRIYWRTAFAHTFQGLVLDEEDTMRNIVMQSTEGYMIEKPVFDTDSQCVKNDELFRSD